ncbi:MAG: alpha/beta hydrolase [Terracidiphilus sp.]
MKQGAPARTAPPTVPGRWILSALAMVAAAAVLCGYGSLCLLFWQGSWQLLYHPSSQVTRTPTSAGLAFDSVAFADTISGQPRMRGWWIPAAAGAPFGRYTVLYLHGQNGNLSNCVDALAALHAAGVNVFAFDYRGYGKSQFVHPSEVHWREDANSALQYLTGTRQIPSNAIVLDGADLGANLALEAAAAHPELAGVMLNSPLEAPLNSVFLDPRSQLVPAHLLVRDRYSLEKPAARLRIPSLWFVAAQTTPQRSAAGQAPKAYDEVTSPKILVWLTDSPDRQKSYADALSRWLDGLPAH